jgi:hypothetical protein
MSRLPIACIHFCNAKWMLRVWTSVFTVGLTIRTVGSELLSKNLLVYQSAFLKIWKKLSKWINFPMRLQSLLLGTSLYTSCSCLHACIWNIFYPPRKKSNVIVSVKIIFAFAQRDMRKDHEYHAGFEPGTSWIQVAAEVCQPVHCVQQLKC